MNDPRVLGRTDTAYVNAVNPFRTRLGLSPVAIHIPADFSGEWVLNEDKSNLGNAGAGNLPARLMIGQDNGGLKIKKTFIEEWEDSRVTDETIAFNSAESKSEYYGAPRISTARLSADKDTLTINSKTTFNRGGQASTFVTVETWSLQNRGNELRITQVADQPQGKRKQLLIYEKQ